MPRPQFSLKALLVATGVVALPLAWLAHNANVVRQRNAILAQFTGGGPLWIGDAIRGDPKPAELPWIRRALGDHQVPALFWEREYGVESAFIRRLRKLFPEARIWLIDGTILEPTSTLRRPPPAPEP